ncbi:ABC transporter permease subunit [Rufibacter radiotolerans]
MFQWGTEKTLGNGAFSVLAYLCTFLVIGFVLLSQLLKNLLGGAKTFALPVDAALQKIIEVWSTFPKLLLLLLLTTFTPFSILTLMGWICATYWVLPARVARASVLQLKQEAFFEATTSLGLPFQRVLVNHLWPSLKGPVITNFCFAASGLMGIGSTLAYLGIGLPADVPSWGKMLASARLSLEAWWLFAFPALLLLITIFSLQAMGNKYSSSKTANSVTNHQ